MTLPDLLDEIADRGWLVSNLFQRDNGSWQANLRTFDHHTEFGRGPSPELALSLAIEAIETATETPAREAVQVSSFTPPSLDIFKLISNLRPSVNPFKDVKGRLP